MTTEQQDPFDVMLAILRQRGREDKEGCCTAFRDWLSNNTEQARAFAETAIDTAVKHLWSDAALNASQSDPELKRNRQE